jgi:hypothetical protein
MDAIEHDGNARPPRSDTRVIVYAGIAVVVLTFGGIGGWAALAEISSAAVGSGVVKIEGERRPVQHLEGGIVREVLVPDGASAWRGRARWTSPASASPNSRRRSAGTRLTSSRSSSSAR